MIDIKEMIILIKFISKQSKFKTFNQTYSYGCTHSGCGCILGCLTISLISFLLSLLIFGLYKHKRVGLNSF